jgi:hypothetical protein
LKAPFVMADGTPVPRSKGVPQGSVGRIASSEVLLNDFVASSEM